jgi:ABC-type transport system involved in multi-copper enzyme maturation permease subunit
MPNKPLLYTGAGILFLIGICLLGYGALSVIGSTSSSGSPNWLTYGLGFGCVGALFLAGGAGLIYASIRGTKTEVIQQLKVDLPANTKVEQMTCKNCGGVLKPDDIKMVNGAPMVVCPYCGTTYQLTEEPKW